jgi:hypothetical protein
MNPYSSTNPTFFTKLHFDFFWVFGSISKLGVENWMFWKCSQPRQKNTESGIGAGLMWQWWGAWGATWPIWMWVHVQKQVGRDFHAVLGSRMGSKLLIFYGRGIFDFGEGLQWMHGLGPCTTPSLGCPPKYMLKLEHFSISFGDFSFFLWNFFQHQTKMELFRFTIGIFNLWKFEDAKKKQEWQYQCQCFVPPPL